MQYKAFISYSHAGDPTLPAALHRSLERFAKPWFRMRSFRIFRDRTNLSIAPGLWPRIESALLDSEFLLFLASPAGAQSKWVQRELALWMERKDPAKMLVVVIDGDIAWDDSTSDFDWTRTTALPQVLRGAFSSEPLYVDFRSWRSAVLRPNDGEFIDRVATVAATLKGVAKDEIIGEQLRQHRRALRLAWSTGTVLGILAVTATGLGIRARHLQLRAELQARVANAQRLATESRAALASGYPRRAVILAAEALKIAMERREARVPAAEEAMRRALAAVSGRALGGHPTDRSFALQFSADGRWLATETAGRIVRLWDLSAGDPATKPLELHDELQPYSIAFTADGKWLVTGAWVTPNNAKVEKDQNSVRLWNLKAPDIAASRKTLPSDAALNAAVLAPDGRRLATAGVDAAVRIWDLTSADPASNPIVLRGHAGPVFRLVFGHDSRHVLSGGADGTVMLWDIDAPGGAPKTLHYGQEVDLLAMSPDGRKVVAAGGRTVPRLWNLQRSPPDSVVLAKIEKEVRNLEMSPDGRWLLTWGSWSYASLTDLDAPHPEATNYILPNEGGPIEHVAFVSGAGLVTSCGYWPDELAAGSNPETSPRLWNLAGNDDPSSWSLPFTGHSAPLTALAVTPDNRWVVTASEDKTVRIWGLNKDRKPDYVLHAAEDLIYNVVVSPDSRWVAAQTGDGTAHLWDLKWPPAAAATSPIKIGSVGDLKDLQTSHDGRWIFTVGDADFLWDLHEHPPASMIHWVSAADGSDGVTRGGLMGRNDRWLAIGHDGGKLRLWYLGGSEPSSRLIIDDPSIDFNGATFIGDGDVLAVHEKTGPQHDGDALRIAALDAQRFAASWSDVPLPSGPLTSFNGSPDGRRLATTGSDRTIRVWTLEHGAVDPKPVELTDTEAAPDVVFTPDGRWLMSSSWKAFRGQKTVRLWRADALAAGAVPAVLEGHSKGIDVARLSPDGHWLATVAFGDRLLLWNLRAEQITPIAVPMPMRLQLNVGVSFSRDGRWLVVSVYQHPPYVWRLGASGIDGPPIVLRGHEFPLVRTAISPDAHWLVTADDDLEYEPRKGRTCRLWDLTSPNPAGSSIILPADDEGVGGVTFSSDGRWLITDGHRDGLALWHVGIESLLDLAAKVAGRPLTSAERVAFLPAQ